MVDQPMGGLTCAEADEQAAAFVLGALTPAEMAAVRRHLADCPNEHADFAALGSVAAALLDTIEPVEPPAGLGDRIMASAHAQRSASLAAAWQPREKGARAPTAGTATARSATSARRRPPYAWIAIGAAAIVIAALGAWNIQLRNQVDDLSAYRTAVLAVLDRAAGPNGQLAVLAAPEDSAGPSGIAGIGADGSLAVAMRDLAPTAGSEVYEVWVIGGNGTPVPVGDFTVGADGAGGTVISTASSEAGVTVALTREPRPGATTPTMPIVALGTARPAGG